MKKNLFMMLALLSTLVLLGGCKEETPKVAEKEAQQPAAEATGAAPAAAGKSGTVTETMDAAGYTYVQVDTGEEKIWAAAPQFEVAVGDKVVVPEGMPMSNYHSKTLDRDFELVYFVDSVLVGGEKPVSAKASQAQMPEDHPSLDVPAAGEESEVDLSGVEKAEGGKTVSEIYQNKENLAGQEVKVRGKVVKFSPQIMGTNWIHVQDGTGSNGSNDLTVTSSTQAEVGDTVLVSGVLTTDKDFGYGYQYDVIIEDAKVAVE